ncbi:MAG: hypothetical protein LQ352_001078 [Teloschistes flavicans]|nr:MAG: hypothetical protein LQ352_001078 [Teloschistes flavicans]
MSVQLATDGDMHKWIVTISGPKESPYAVSSHSLFYGRVCSIASNGCELERPSLTIYQQGGRFVVQVILPPNYPFKPPVISWQTKIYHPNVSNDEKGTMCLGMLRDGEWKPSSKLSNALGYIRQLMIEPDVDDAIEQNIAREFKEDRKEFVKKAKKWTKDYA